MLVLRNGQRVPHAIHKRRQPFFVKLTGLSFEEATNSLTAFNAHLRRAIQQLA